MTEIPRKNRFDKEPNQFREIRDIIRDREIWGVSNLNIPETELKLIVTAIMDDGTWGDLSADSNEHPDFSSEKYKMMMEFMNVDCEDIAENGKINSPNSIAVGKKLHKLGNIIENDDFRDCIVYTTPNNDNAVITDTYQNYLNGFKRVVSKHIQKISEYRAEHPNYKLGFVLIDYTVRYYVCSCIEDVERFDLKEPVNVELHKWVLDSAFMNVFNGADVDFVVWYAPFKMNMVNGKNDVPMITFIDPKTNTNLIDYDPTLIVFDPYADGYAIPVSESDNRV